MKKILVISFILILANSAVQLGTFAESRIIRTVSNVPVSNYDNNMYNAELYRIENYLFGTCFVKNDLQTRLNRIEKRIFNQTFSNMMIAQRMNNILANYRDDYNNRNYLTDSYSNSTVVDRIRNRMIGQPTGFSPSVINATPFGMGTYNPTFNRGFTSNRGYGYSNSIPATTGMGIHILDWM